MIQELNAKHRQLPCQLGMREDTWPVVNLVGLFSACQRTSSTVLGLSSSGFNDPIPANFSQGTSS